MNRIAFVQNLTYEYLGVMYLSAALKQAGHCAEVFILEGNEKELIRDVVNFQPSVVAFSVTTGIHKWAVEFAASLKQVYQTLTMFGGPHPTFFPELIENPSVDIICRGEGELAIVDIANKLNAEKSIEDTLNCQFKLDGQIKRNDLRPLIEDLDSIPNPDREIYRAKYPYLRKSQAAFMAGRGCPFGCSFCFNHALQKLYQGCGRFIRFRDPEKVIQEIMEAKSRWNLRTVYMQDDTFILNKRWVQKFSELYRKQVKLPMLCLVRADLVDEDIVSALKYAGVKNVFFGIESGDETLRNELLNKGVSNEDIYRTASLLKKYGISFRTYNMVGLPDETLEQALKTVQINADIRTNFPWCSVFHPFPGTKLGEFAVNSNIITRSPEDAPPSFFKESIISLPQSNEIINLQKLFFYGVKFPWLMPLIKRLIQLRPNPIFNFLFLLGYAVSLIGSENLSFAEALSIGMRNVRQFFLGKP
jgi:radical SAM superfamily enzyme YgiQ (UPF0313 family)